MLTNGIILSLIPLMKIRTLPNGKFLVDTGSDEKRERKIVNSRAIAEALLKQKQIEAYEISLGLDRLTPKQRMIAVEIFRVLPPEMNILDIVLAHIKKTNWALQKVELEPTIEAFLEGLRRGNRSKSYILSI